MIRVESLTKRYSEKAVVDNISFELPTEQIVAIIGSNGAGKSTVLSIISRLIAASGGQIFIDDRKLSEWKSRELSRHLSILSQSNHFNIRLTVKELARFGRFPHSQGKLTAEDEEKVQQALEYADLTKLQDRYIDELSGGQRQMAYIAMAIAQDTQYIMLDEPLNNLDMRRSVKIMKMLRKLVEEKKKTIILVIHDINFVSCYADYIVAMKEGVVQKAGPTGEIIRPDVLRDIYDMDIEIEEHRGKNICIYYA